MFVFHVFSAVQAACFLGYLPIVPIFFVAKDPPQSMYAQKPFDPPAKVAAAWLAANIDTGLDKQH